MRPERTVQQHLVVQHGALGFEVGQRSRQQQDERNMPLYLKYSVKNALSFSNGMMSI